MYKCIIAVSHGIVWFGHKQKHRTKVKLIKGNGVVQ